MAYCASRTVVKHEGENLSAHCLRCRSWHCDECYQNRKARLIAEAIGGRPNTFLTLTLRAHGKLDFPQACKTLSRGWRLVRLRALREAGRDRKKKLWPFGADSGWQGPVTPKHPAPHLVQLSNGPIPFLAVIEKHKSGWPHLHILMRAAWIDFRWLQAQWQEIVGAHHVRIERLKNKEKGAAYCAKYCGKVRDEIIGAKRYWSTRDYDLRPDWEQQLAKRPPHWCEVLNLTIDEVVAGWKRVGYLVEVLGVYEARARPPPGGAFGSEAHRRTAA